MNKKRAELVLLGVLPAHEGRIGAALERIATVVASIEELERWEQIGGGPPGQILLVNVDPDPDLGFLAVEKLSSAAATRPVIVLSEKKDSDLVLRAMRAGARDFAVLDDDCRDVVRAVGDMARERVGVGLAKVVSVLQAKGGAGATTIATNFAGAAKAERGGRTLLMDLDLTRGDCLLFLDLGTKYTIADAQRNLHRLDGDLLDELLAIHPTSNVHVVAQTEDPDDAEQVTPEGLGTLLNFFQRQFELVVIDGIRGFDALSLTALGASHKVLVVLSQDLPGIKNARRTLETLRRLDFPSDRIELVLNRHQKNAQLDLNEIADAVGRPVSATVANDFRTISEGINRGLLLSESAPRARVTADIKALVPVVLGSAESHKNGAIEKKSMLSGLFSWRRAYAAG